MQHTVLFGSVSLTSMMIPVMVDSSFRWAVVFATVALATVALCRVSAAVRHTAWICSLVALLVMPVFVVVLPAWRVLPWQSNPSVEVMVSQAPSTSTVDTNQASTQLIDSPELEAVMPPLTLELAAMDRESHPTAISDAQQADDPVVVWLTPLEKLGLLWSVGVVICLIRLLAGWIVIGRIVATCKVADRGSLNDLVDSIRNRLGIEAAVRVYVARHPAMPMAWGIWRPAVLLPQEAHCWGRDQLEAVMLHELGHIRRRDPVTHLFAQLVCALHWLNPLVWFAVWRLGVERERACDELVIRAGLKPSTYAEQLLTIVSRYDSSGRIPSTAVAMAHRGRLERRIAAILDPRATRKEMTVRTFILTLLIATGTTLAAASLHAQQEPVAETVEQDQQRPEMEALPNPLRNPGFEESEPGSQDFAWKLGRVSEEQPLQGKRSGYLSSARVGYRPSLLQATDAEPYRGKRIRYRAAVRVESDDESGAQAQLWFRVDRRKADGSRAVGAFDNMNDRPITSDNWRYYDLVGDVHDDASRITLGMFFNGRGKVWIDDASIQVVGDDVEVTTIRAAGATAKGKPARPTQVRNSGFEEGEVGGRRIVGWYAPQLNGYRATISDQEPKVGAQCGLLQRDDGTDEKKHYGALNSGLDATPYRGKRVRFRAAVRTMVEGAGNQAQLWFRVDRPRKDGAPVIGAFDNMHDRPITATQWQYYDIVGDIAPDAQGIVFGMLLMGDGKAFIDDASFEIVDNDVEPTAKVRPQPRGASVSQLGPGLFEILGSMEVVSTRQVAADEEADEATLLLPLPLSYRDQIPLSYQLTAEPADALKSAEIYQDQPSNFVAKVVLSNLSEHRKVDLTFRSSVLVGPSSFDGVPKTAPIPEAWPDEAEKWLASTWCVQADHDRIESIANEIREQTDDVLQIIASVERKAHSIFRSASGHVRNLTAVEALDKRGSCTSCGNLVAALLRGCDVPARVLAGYPSWSGPLQTHYIVEAYVPDYGWYPVESTKCQSPWPNFQQVNVAIIPPEYESEDVAGRRRNVAGGVPYLSLTEGQGTGFYTHGTIEGARHCDHQCKLIRKYASSDAQWSQAMQWAKSRWANWLSSGPPIDNGRLAFGPAVDEVNAQTLQGLVADLSR